MRAWRYRPIVRRGGGGVRWGEPDFSHSAPEGGGGAGTIFVNVVAQTAR